MIGVQGEAESDGPSESQCRPYIEKALKELETAGESSQSQAEESSKEDIPTIEIITDDSSHEILTGEDEAQGTQSTENTDESLEVIN